MSDKSQIDYDALAEQARGKAASVPKKSSPPAVDYEALAEHARQAAAPLPAQPATVPPPAPLPSQEGFFASLAAPFADAAKGLWHTATDRPQGVAEQIAQILGPVGLPLKRAVVDPAIDQGKQAVSEFQQANTATPWYSMHPSPAAVNHRELALGHTLAAVTPMVGPWAASVGEKEGEQLGTGNYEGASGTAVGNTLLALAPKAVGKMAAAAPEAAQSVVRRLAGSGPGVARELARSATEDNRAINLHNSDKLAEARQKWQDAQAKANADHQAEVLRLRQKYMLKDTPEAQAEYEAARAKAEKANADAQREYNQKIGEVAQHNRTATEAARTKVAQAARLQVGGSQLITGLQQLDKALRARAGEMYDAIREKVGNTSLPGAGLATAAKTALQAVKGTTETPKVFRDIASKYPESDPSTIAYQGAQIPRGHPLYDVLAQNGAVTAPPVTFTDLQGYYSELGSELSKGTLPSDVYLATRALQDSIGDMMQDIAKQNGVNNQFIDARKFYREYMDTFHEPTGPSSSGSPVAQALLAKDPLVAAEKFTGNSANRGIADLRKYSHGLANLAQDMQRVGEEKVSVPARKSAMDIPTPKTKPVPAGANLPLPPVLPEPESVPYREPKLSPTQTISEADLRRANEASVQRRGSSAVGSLIRLSVVWPAFHMLSDLMRGREVSPGGLAAIPAAGATSMAIDEILAHQGVREFLIRPTRQQIAQIPLNLRGDMPQIVAAAKSHGLPVSPLLASYAAAIQHNQGAQQPSPTTQGAPQ